MKAGQRLSRRNLLKLGAATGMAAVVTGGARGEAEQKDGGPKASAGRPETPAAPQIRLIADKILEWQAPTGRLDVAKCPLVDATEPTRIYSYVFLGIGMARAFDITGLSAYAAAADRFAVYYLSLLEPTPRLRPPDYGFGLRLYRELKRRYPGQVDWDAKAAALFAWIAPWRWNEGSYYRNGYPGGRMKDAGNITDLADTGVGLMSYYAVSKNPKVLAEAEGLSNYFLTEIEPFTYKGCWSSKLGTWAIAPSDESRIEHFTGVRVCDIGWGISAIEGIDYLTQLAAATQNKELKARIRDKCVSAMKWQFDACQFDDGACGMIGRDDDKWLGMTAGAVLSYLRNRDAGLLSERDAAKYRPKALAARDWMLEYVRPETIQSPTVGYVRVTGRSTPTPPDDLAIFLGWALEALCRVHEI